MPEPEEPIEPIERVSRSLKICRLFVANLAFFRAKPKDLKLNEFWRLISNNCVDHSTLEWCKIFGDADNKDTNEHGWKRIIRDTLKADDEAFFQTLLAHLAIDKPKFEELRVAARAFRDQFIAHLDEARVMNIPQFDLYLQSIFFFHDFVRKAAADQSMTLQNYNIQQIYADCLKNGGKEYMKALA